MLTRQKLLMIEQYKRIYSTHKNTVIFLDHTLKCIHSTDEDVFPVGHNIVEFVPDTLPFPIKRFYEVRLCRSDHIYCLRILPITDELGESWLYICELIDSDSAVEISQRTDISSELISVFETLNFNIAGIWNSAENVTHKLLKQEQYDTLEQVLEIEKRTANISSVFKNYYDLTKMLYIEPNNARIDAAALSRFLIKKCNSALAKCGRNVELLIEPEDLQIYVDMQRIISALVNALQNALLYSPADTVPIMKVYRKTMDIRSFVVFSIVNENIMYTKNDFKDRTDIDFSYQRVGFGIPLIRRFVEQARGSFELDITGKFVTLTITLPAANEEKGPLLAVEDSEMHDFRTSTPDLIDIKMREVADFFQTLQSNKMDS